MASRDVQYHPKDALKEAATASMITGSAGAFFLRSPEYLDQEKPRTLGYLHTNRKHNPIMGGAYEFTKNAAANLREKDDSLNPALGGLFAGAVMGLRRGTTPSVLGYGALTAVVMGTYHYTGAALTGYKKDKEIDEFERKQFLRKNRRVPIEQTVAELGEGRGIYPPGYDERRKERIKENYGIDVPAKSTHS
ncbi:NADH-ubiquinone oxidoreductase 21.3 kDa subunit [Lachnellula subtilissima]|uniref:NADH-ubiquinone oxidoreductase 21.3 kDa subunit n=1 Tax=Lachnellula subtilissima TaxID=602034 RepID=A0A8H8S2I3_9HELO|nr:NADH-ubiquinone oxidoreductase 21.3 kDa subunit [Lachnellula subtilissima]